jgi:hypothetical protein
MVDRGVPVTGRLHELSHNTHTITLHPKEDRTMRYLALGDSYPIGESVDPSDCFLPISLVREP